MDRAKYFPLSLVSITACVCATTYYVASDGLSGNAGASDAAPLATIAGAVAKARSGDIICLRRGDIFRESATIPSGVTVKDYGDAAKSRPVVSGGMPVTGWSVWRGSIHVASVSQKVEMLYVDNRLILIARYPNRGWLHVRTISDNSGNTLVDVMPGLENNPRSVNGYWKGAYMRWRRWSWWYETRTVVDNSGSTRITVAGPAGGFKPWTDGWGFYMDSKLEELDTEGEWYHDAAAMKVYLWAPGGKDPNTLSVEGTVRGNGLSGSGITVQNIALRHQKENGLSISGASSVSHCSFEGIGGEGTGSHSGTGPGLGGSGGKALSIGSGGKKTVSGCLFKDNLNVSIAISDDASTDNGSIIEYDTILNSGVVPAYGGQGSWHGAGIIYYSCKGYRIRYCIIDSTGYAGIIGGSGGNFIEYNLIKRAMSTMNDGAGIYLNTGNTTIRHNIVLDCRGEMEANGGFPCISNGIWPEYLSNFSNNVIDSNISARNGNMGLWLSNNFNAKVRGNIFYGNLRKQMRIDAFEHDVSKAQNHVIENNVLYATEANQVVFSWATGLNYGRMSGNYFCKPSTDRVISAPSTNQDHGVSASDMTVPQWQSAYPLLADMTAKTDPIKRPATTPASNPLGTSKLIINDQLVRRSVPIGDNGRYQTLDGKVVSGTVELEPFAGIVLVHTGETVTRADVHPPVFRAPARESGKVFLVDGRSASIRGPKKIRQAAVLVSKDSHGVVRRTIQTPACGRREMGACEN